MSKKVLFVCTGGYRRSATAAELFTKKYGWNCRAVGSAEWALVPLKENLIKWADRVYFMLEENVLDTYSYVGKETHVLGIPDKWKFRAGGLVRELESKVAA